MTHLAHLRKTRSWNGHAWIEMTATTVPEAWAASFIIAANLLWEAKSAFSEAVGNLVQSERWKRYGLHGSRPDETFLPLRMLWRAIRDGRRIGKELKEIRGKHYRANLGFYLDVLEYFYNYFDDGVCLLSPEAARELIAARNRLYSAARDIQALMDDLANSLEWLVLGEESFQARVLAPSYLLRSIERLSVFLDEALWGTFRDPWTRIYTAAEKGETPRLTSRERKAIWEALNSAGLWAGEIWLEAGKLNRFIEEQEKIGASPIPATVRLETY